MCTASLILLAALDLGTLFANKGAWTTKSELFAVEHAKDGFEFASETRDLVNCLKHDTCTWHGLKVYETRVYFDKGGEEERVARVELSLYNRGDAGGDRLDAAALERMLDKVVREFVPGGVKDKPERTALKNGAFQYRRAFPRTDPSGELVWGTSSGFGGGRSVDYVRLVLTPKGGVKARRGSLARRASGAAGKTRARDNVTKGPNGDVFIDNVPMVDQGQKGYCSAAVSERVLRYYGNTIDEHEIAQMAGTSARGGTEVSALKRAVTAIGAKNGLGFQDIVSLASGDFEKEIAQYNRAAKAERKPALSLASFVRGNVIYVSEMYEAMDKTVIYRMRQKDPRFKKFISGVRQQVDAGIPVFWGVTLGIYPERCVNPQSRGGHMRLIIGYNEKKSEILFSDTWGEGHELKRMPEDWAFAITSEAFCLKPR